LEKQNGVDTHGRTLAYVFLPDGSCLNEVMIAEGYARPFSKYYCKALAQYQQLHMEAKAQLRGLFANDFFNCF
jgi:micrococcal nuclease